MQIGPSLSVLQALGSHPGTPEPARLKAAAQVAATADVQRALETRKLEADPAGGASGRGGQIQATLAPGATEPGRRVDILA